MSIIPNGNRHGSHPAGHRDVNALSGRKKAGTKKGNVLDDASKASRLPSPPSRFGSRMTPWDQSFMIRHPPVVSDAPVIKGSSNGTSMAATYTHTNHGYRANGVPSAGERKGKGRPVPHHLQHGFSSTAPSSMSPYVIGSPISSASSSVAGSSLSSATLGHPMDPTFFAS